MASDKSVVVERIWDVLQTEGKGRTTVYFQDVIDAIAHCNKIDNKKRSAKNPANFMKDLVRSDNASKNWPDKLSSARMGARQRVGRNRVFEFQPYAVDQTEPFPNVHMPTPDMVPEILQSLSLPLASKALGRRDESWLIQIVVGLHVLEHHFASRSKLGAKELVHLQTGVKLAGSEVDGLFRVIVEEGGRREHVLITCEAKQQGERILEHQIVEQIGAAYASVRDSVPEEELAIWAIVPVAIKAIPPHGDIYVVEFEPWDPAEAEAEESAVKDLIPASVGLYRLTPPVPGVGFKPKRPRKARKPKISPAAER
jgi:hypothetical protein